LDTALIASAALLGLAGMPHCAAMCGAPCAAATGTGAAPVAAFQVARVAGYAAVGAAASASVGALAALVQWTPALRPLWVLFHAALLALGLWLLWQGRQPAWMGSMGRVPAAAAGSVTAGGAPVRVWRSPARASLAGALWVAWPCGLLQSALLVASLTQTAAAGAAAMAAVASSGGLLAAPALWRWLQGRGRPQTIERQLARAAGALLVLGSGFALGQGLWHTVAVACGWA
jgi:uncharacterized protein